MIFFLARWSVLIWKIKITEQVYATSSNLKKFGIQEKNLLSHLSTQLQSRIRYETHTLFLVDVYRLWRDNRYLIHISSGNSKYLQTSKLQITSTNRSWASISDINNKNISCTLISCWYCKRAATQSFVRSDCILVWKIKDWI